MSKLLDIIKELQTNDVLPERAAFIKEQVESLENFVVHLQKENTGLKQQLSQLNAEFAAKTKADEFIEKDGAFFKVDGSKGYHRAAFCLTCKGPMVSLEDVPFTCTKCGISVNFTGRELDVIIKSLPKRT